jgi:LemA protein
MMFGHKEKPQFTVENEKEIARPPTVDFGTGQPSRDRAQSPRPAPPPSGGSEYPVPGK